MWTELRRVLRIFFFFAFHRVMRFRGLNMYPFRYSLFSIRIKQDGHREIRLPFVCIFAVSLS